MAQTREERIREKAHALWDQEGRPDGQHSRHWEDAEKLVNEADSIAAGESSKDPTHQPRNR
jgi:Protein of unknown function (DUF2934)